MAGARQWKSNHRRDAQVHSLMKSIAFLFILFYFLGLVPKKEIAFLGQTHALAELFRRFPTVPNSRQTAHPSLRYALFFSEKNTASRVFEYFAFFGSTSDAITEVA
jgi:hypothetical protein